MPIDSVLLNKLCQLVKLQTNYKDQQNRTVSVDMYTLIGVLESLLDREIKSDADIDDILADPSHQEPLIPRVIVAWDGLLQIPVNKTHQGYDQLMNYLKAGALDILLEDSSTLKGYFEIQGGEPTISLSSPLPLGYHEITDGLQNIASFIISAPTKCPPPPGGDGNFAVFAPPYSLVDNRFLPRGDLSGIELLGRLSSKYGAHLIATLPMFAEASKKDGASPGQSPYSPLSRSFLNEAYLDIEKIPEISEIDTSGYLQSIPAGMLHTYQDKISADLASRADEIAPLLLRAAQNLTAGRHKALLGQRESFAKFCETKDNLEAYANFRAVMRLYGTDIEKWPASFQNGNVDQKALDQDLILIHKYAQFAADRQLKQVKKSLEAVGSGFLFDLPIGCDKNSFDVWAYGNHFSHKATIGAPPDDFFQGGQNWGLAPLLPHYDRLHQYSFFRNTLRSSLIYSDVLRIDHILGFSRLWWIPNGREATEGAYVSYETNELLAIACLEAHRTGTHLLGEDLGTVEDTFRQQLRSHGISQMRVGVFEFKDKFTQYTRGQKDASGTHEISGLSRTEYDNQASRTKSWEPNTDMDSEADETARMDFIHSDPFSSAGTIQPEAIDEAPANSRAFLYIDTHDTATFAGWLESADIDIMLKLCPETSYLDQDLYLQRQILIDKMRQYFDNNLDLSSVSLETAATVFGSESLQHPLCLQKEHLFAAVLLDGAISPVSYLVVSLEDLIGEVKQQNIPGTGRLDGNFCRLLSMPLEDIFQDNKVTALLEMLQTGRQFARDLLRLSTDRSQEEK